MMDIISLLFAFLLLPTGWDWYNWESDMFKYPLFEPLRIAREQGYQLFDTDTYGHHNSTLFGMCSN